MARQGRTMLRNALWSERKLLVPSPCMGVVVSLRCRVSSSPSSSCERPAGSMHICSEAHTRLQSSGRRETHT